MELQKNKMHNEQYKKACRIAYRLLTYRDRTEYEINKKLKEKGFEPNIINEVIEHLRENDFINDQKYVKRFIAESKFCSRAKICVSLPDFFSKDLDALIIYKFPSFFKKIKNNAVKRRCWI